MPRPRAKPRRSSRDARPVEADPDAHPAETCGLCGRGIPPGAKASRHHLVPRLKGGARLGTVRLHQVCHSAIHARFTETELARRLADLDSLRADPELARFVAWVRTKPDDFHAPTRTSAALKERRGKRERRP